VIKRLGRNLCSPSNVVEPRKRRGSTRRHGVVLGRRRSGAASACSSWKHCEWAAIASGQDCRPFASSGVRISQGALQAGTRVRQVSRHSAPAMLVTWGRRSTLRVALPRERKHLNACGSPPPRRLVSGVRPPPTSSCHTTTRAITRSTLRLYLPTYRRCEESASRCCWRYRHPLAKNAELETACPRIPNNPAGFHITSLLTCALRVVEAGVVRQSLARPARRAGLARSAPAPSSHAGIQTLLV